MPTEAIPDQLPDETAAGEPQPAAEKSAGETHSADREPPEVTLEKAASYLVALKQAAANQGLAFDYYSATVYGRNIT